MRRGFRGAVRGAFLAGLAGLVALLLAAAPPAEAQTITMSAVGSATGPGITDGDRDPNTTGLQINEGDSVTLTVTANGLTEGSVSGTLNYRPSPTSGAAYGQNMDYVGPNIGGTQSPYSIAYPATTQPFTITTRVDGDPEGDESFVFSFSGAPLHLDSSGSATGDTWTHGTPTSITVTILQNDGYSPTDRTLTVTGPGTIEEDGDTGSVESGQYTVTLAGTAFSTATTVTWTVMHGTTTDADFAAASDRRGTVTFPANSSTAQRFTLTVANDNLNEAGETFTVQASVANAMADGGTAFGTAASTTITDDDAIAVTVTASEGTADADGDVTCAASTTATATVTEGRYACLNVDLGAIPSRDITVGYTIGSDTDDATVNAVAADYTHTGSTGSIMITAAAGADTGMISIPIVADNLNESAETFTVTITAADITGEHGTATVASGGTQTFTIADNDDITVTITQQTPASGAAADENATATFRVALSGGVRTSVVTVPFAFTGTLDNAEYAITAPTGIQATATGGTVTFGTGGTPSATDHSDITVNLQGDSVNEATETLILTGAAPGASGLRVASGGGDIAYASGGGETATLDVSDDDDITYGLVFGTASGTEADPGGAAVTVDVTVTLSGATSTAWDNINVPFTVHSSSTADLTDDYTISASPLTFTGTANEQQSVTVTIVADELNEANETVVIDFGAATGTGSGGGALTAGATTRSTVTINDDDDLRVIINGPASNVDEGAAAEFAIDLSGGVSQNPVSVTLSFSGTATGGADASGNPDYITPSATFTIPAGQARATLSIPIRHDGVDEGATPETLTVTISSPTARGIMASGSATANINNVNTARTLAISATTASADEGGDLVFTVTVEGEPVSETFPVRWSVTTGAGEISGTTGDTLNFGTSDMRTQTQTITLRANDDTDSEGADTVTVTLTDPCPSSGVCGVGGREGLGSQTPAMQLVTAMADGTIRESDRPVTVRLTAPDSTNLGTAVEGQAADFTVSFAESVTTTAAVQVDYTISFPDASDTVNPASAADFAATTGTVDIPAGMSTATLAITSTDDAVNEAMESYIVTISNARGGGAIAAPTLDMDVTTRSGEASISASDPVRVRLARRAGQTGNVREGNEAEFTVSLSLAADGSPGATSGGDICVPFQVDVVSPASAPPVNTADTGADIEGVSDCDGMAVTVRLTARNTGDAFSQAEGGVLIPAGQSSADFSIRARFDGVEETANENMEVEITAPTARAGAEAVTLARELLRTVTVPIENVNSLRTLEVSAAALTGDEDSASMPGGSEAFVSYTVGIMGEDLTEEVSVNWSLAGADGANLPGASASGSNLGRQHGGDHTPDFGRAGVVEAGGGTVNADGISGTLIFPVGAAPIMRTVRVPLMQDALNEGAETLTLTVTDPCPATGVCLLGGGGGGASMTPALQLGTGERAATVPASDPAMLRITRVGSGTVVSGEGITYQVSLGTTFLNGQSTPVLASAPLTVMVPLQVGGADSGQSFTVEVPAEQSSAQAAVSAAVLSQALSGQSGTPMLSLGMAMVSGAPGPGGGAATVTAPDPGDPADSANLPAPVQTAAWELTRALPETPGEAPESSTYEITYTLRGSETPTGGLSFTWEVTGRALADGGEAAVAADFARAAGYTCGAAAVGATCTSLPSGTVTFAAGNSSQTIAIAVRDDSADNPAEGRGPGGAIRAEGFALTFNALSGTDVARVEYAAGASLPSTLQVDIPALRADLSVANATAAEGASAMFVLTLGGFVGGDATIQPITVAYALSSGAQPGGAELGVDFTAPATAPGITDCPAQRICARIPAGAQAGEAHRIEVPLRQDGVLEPRETFTLTITGASGGGGTIRLVPDPAADPVVVADEINATGTITDDADQAARRRQRVGALVTVLDRQTALLAADAISARLSRPRSDSAQSAPGSLSIANRNLINARNATSTRSSTAGVANGATSLRGTGAAGVASGATSLRGADAAGVATSMRGGAAGGNTGAGGAAGGAEGIGLALYGAAGQGGAAAGLPGGKSAGRSAFSRAVGFAGGAGGGAGAARFMDGGAGAARFMDGSASAAFGGLGAGLAGGANLGTRTALPTLAQLMNGSSFRFGAASDVLAGFANFAGGIEVWGSGGYVDLRSESRNSGLTYDGESIAAFLGADAIVPQLPNLLAGLAVGWSAGDLDFTDRAGGFTMRGKLENNSLSLHPYFGWQLSPHANAWLVLGFGAGSVDIEENEGSGANAVSRKLDGGDSSMLMFSTGISGTQQIGETGDLKLRFALTRVQSRVDSGRFDDGALLPQTRGRSLRFGGEAEVGRRITLENGLALRPFGTLRVRLDNASAESGVENAAIDWGAGITAAWSDLGLDGSFAFRRQLNDTGDEEQGVSLDLSFAPGALGQGIAISLQSALQQRRPGLANADGGLGNALLGTNNALGNSLGGGNSFGASNALGNANNALGSASGAGMQHTLSGEIAYGMALRYFGHSDASRSALLTPYGRFHLGNANTRWAAGLRLANPRGLQLGLEAGLDLNSAATSATAATATPRAYDLLLTGRLNF